ncbi:cytochrome c oxidase assembly protein [Vibrio gallicus]|uniref:cytochrome c oxidase assembly protein n=1 Tax=Vibrio gallicus TaxID=190897 RepID=UPI0021C2D026|nr:cytochrome c oxidase assembly protein [Vibrio gallicus]
MPSSMSNKKLTAVLCGTTLAMFGFGFALVPLYDILCEQLGINGKTSSEAAVAPLAMQVDTSRTIKVEFISHIANDLPLTFEPQKQVIQVHPGQVVRTAYFATNQSKSPMIAQAVPSVSPGMGATHFNKIECFCFNHQPLQGLAKAELPLIFYVEHDLPQSIHTLTLAYTLYDISPKPASATSVSSLEIGKRSSTMDENLGDTL